MTRASAARAEHALLGEDSGAVALTSIIQNQLQTAFADRNADQRLHDLNKHRRKFTDCKDNSVAGEKMPAENERSFFSASTDRRLTSGPLLVEYVIICKIKSSVQRKLATAHCRIRYATQVPA